MSPIAASALEFLTAAPRGTHLNRLKKLLPRKFRPIERKTRQVGESIEVFLHHDADRQAYKTVEMIELEHKMGVISSNYFFYERNVWDDDHETYVVPVEPLISFEKHGFEIGYHLNAYELANYELSSAIRIMERDVAWFRANFSLKTYVPHGGVRGPGGLNNLMMPRVGSLKSLIRAYNGFGVYCDNSWSDGSVGSTVPQDPREIMRTATHGSRIRVLMHPQYYGNSLCKNYSDYAISKCDWWRKLWGI